jgi:hypothetical protein
MREDVFRGLLLKESLRDEGILDMVRVTDEAVWDVAGRVEEWQPGRWTAVSFEGDDTRADELAERMSRAIKPKWYANLSTETHAYVVFADWVFKYVKGDSEARARAQEYAISVGVPQSQVDWGE